MSTAFTHNTWKIFSSKLPMAKQRKFLSNRGPQTLRFRGAASTFVRYEFFTFSAMGICKKNPTVFRYNSTRRDNPPTHYSCLSKKYYTSCKKNTTHLLFECNLSIKTQIHSFPDIILKEVFLCCDVKKTVLKFV